jgi:hypothetical protein
MFNLPFKFSVSCIAFVCALAAAGLSACGHPNVKAVKAMSDARSAVSEAITGDVQKYAPDDLNEAQSYLSKAEYNFKNFHYAEAEIQAEAAVRLAKKAEAESGTKLKMRARNSVKGALAARRKREKVS